MNYMRNIIITSNHDHTRVIANVTKSLISTLALWCKVIDFHILAYLLQEVSNADSNRVGWALDTLIIILEDIKF
jgi:hypothetical protein